MKSTLSKLIQKIPYIKGLREQISAQGRYPAGHYYSPIPLKRDVQALLSKIDHSTTLRVDEVELQIDHQREVLERLTLFYEELPFTEDPDKNRYYFNQSWFRYFDAISLYGFLRDKNPKRIIEVGSGYSSAVMLDTIDLFLVNKPKMIFIEPNPERLNSLLRDGDRANVTILEIPVQEVNIEIFTELEENDLLFIDSSHVLKYGSDLHYLFFQIIPRMNVGVFIHFHDIIYPFEYFKNWLQEGRYWNEAYFLRAFLAYNDSWKIHFFNSFAATKFANELSIQMPLCLKDPGGSIYIQRVK